MNAIAVHRVYTSNPDQGRQVSALLALLKAPSQVKKEETTGVSLQALPVVSARTVQPDAGGSCV